jgi:hypothetical protein
VPEKEAVKKFLVRCLIATSLQLFKIHDHVLYHLSFLLYYGLNGKHPPPHPPKNRYDEFFIPSALVYNLNGRKVTTNVSN